MAETQKRIPRFEAFASYVALGSQRSYETVAKTLGVSRRGIEQVARRDRWAARLREVEARAQEQMEAQLVESIATMKQRQLQTLRVVNARALEALQKHPLRSAMDGVRALEMSIKLERAIMGVDQDSTQEVVRELRQREEDSLLADDDEDGEGQGSLPCDVEFELVADMGDADASEDVA